MFLYKCKKCGSYTKVSNELVMKRTKIHHCMKCMTPLPDDLIYYAYAVANYPNTFESEGWEIFSVPDNFKDLEIVYEPQE